MSTVYQLLHTGTDDHQSHTVFNLRTSRTVSVRAVPADRLIAIVPLSKKVALPKSSPRASGSISSFVIVPPLALVEIYTFQLVAPDGGLLLRVIVTPCVALSHCSRV